VRRNTLIFILLFATIFMMAGLPSLRFKLTHSQPLSSKEGRGYHQCRDSVIPDNTAPDTTRSKGVENSDSIGQPSLLESSGEAIPDTTQMDSLQLLIYKRNKAIDDSLRLDSLNRQRKNSIEAPVEYSAQDSMTYEAEAGVAHLYGSAVVSYENMNLQSDQIHMSLDSNIVRASGTSDSLGVVKGSPIFKMGSDTYENDTIAFNFKTKKGLITGVYTEQDEGFLTSEVAKRGANGELFLQHGKYTTCDEPHPDFYLALSRAKVRPGKDVVFGPAYLVVADVPLPFAIPYGFFPFTKNYSSGFIMPTYGDETSRGFYLRDGGYYFAISDKMDLKLIGDIYTKGSWSATATSNYKKRYKFNGSFLVSYQSTVTGDKNMPDYQKDTSFKLTWTHNQDPKANPFSTLSARVNYSTQNYERNNLTSMYNPQALTQTTRTSSVSWQTQFSSIGMTLNSTFDFNQNMRDSTISVTLPSLNISVTRFYPFKRKSGGKERWYEKIGIQYKGEIRNSITAKEDKILHTKLNRDWQNGMKHDIPISANFTLFDVLNVNPSFNFTDRMYLNSVQKSWDQVTQSEVSDTVSGFHNVYNWSLNLGLTTKLYGMYVPSRKIFGDKIVAIRHVLTPTVTFSHAPDFSASRYGYFKTYQKTNADGSVEMVEYSPYQGYLFSPPLTKGRTGSMSIDLSNNVEMKIRSDADTTGFKKISLIDELRFGMSYNFASHDQPLSPLSTSVRIKLTKSYTLNLSTSFASYVYELDSLGNPQESRNTTYWEKGKWGRFQSLSQNISYTLDNTKVAKFFRWLRGESTDEDRKVTDDRDTEEDDKFEDAFYSNMDRDMEKGAHRAKRESSEKAETDEDGYMAFSMPWSLSFGYGITVSENRSGKFNTNTMRYPYKLSHTLNVSGNLRISDGWDINFRSGYDFENKKISMTTASLSRDLHCFNMSCEVTLAPYTSYNFSFRCNAATLTDVLKYDKRSSYSGAVQWY
jgi:lipopolysaccharide assembly outer membrane protein LptD (OstA)